MTALELIREQIKSLYKCKPEIHISTTLTNPKLFLSNASARITGVYPHIFQIEESTSGNTRLHSLQYTDVFIKRIKISELEAEKK